MSVSSNLLCSFELLKPLDSSALKSHIKKGRNARQNMLNSPVRCPGCRCLWHERADSVVACANIGTKLLGCAHLNGGQLTRLIRPLATARTGPVIPAPRSVGLTQF